jgi:hypothetical protein
MEQMALSERLERCGETIIGQIDSYDLETSCCKFVEQSLPDAAGCASNEGDFSVITHGGCSQ